MPHLLGERSDIIPRQLTRRRFLILMGSAGSALLAASCRGQDKPRILIPPSTPEVSLDPTRPPVPTPSPLTSPAILTPERSLFTLPTPEIAASRLNIPELNGLPQKLEIRSLKGRGIGLSLYYFPIPNDISQAELVTVTVKGKDNKREDLEPSGIAFRLGPSVTDNRGRGEIPGWKPGQGINFRLVLVTGNPNVPHSTIYPWVLTTQNLPTRDETVPGYSAIGEFRTDGSGNLNGDLFIEESDFLSRHPRKITGW